MSNDNALALFDALSVPLILANEVTESDIKKHVEQQTLLRDVIVGKNNPDDYLDYLNDNDTSPDLYLDELDIVLDILGF